MRGLPSFLARPSVRAAVAVSALLSVAGALAITRHDASSLRASRVDREASRTLVPPTARSVAPPRTSTPSDDVIAIGEAFSRVANDALAFSDIGQGHSATAPGGRVQVVIDDTGARVRVERTAGEAHLAFGGVSRRGSFSTHAAGHAVPGACVDSTSVLTDGSCLRRVERRVDEVVEWWRNRGHGLEHGFDVARRPGGSGALELLVRVDGADVEIDEDQLAATLYTSDEDSLRYAGLSVVDARGRTLPARFEPHSAGLVVRVDDAGASYPIVVDPIVTSNRLVIAPGTGVTTFGRSVAGAGDVNGDGFGDVIIGAPGMSNGQAGEGRVYVYFGAAAGGASSMPWTWEPNAADYAAGTAVGGAGDLNGDGYADVIVGAPATATILGGFGYVFFGGAAGLPAAPSFTKSGTTKSMDYGIAVAGVGDIDGDGFGDAAIGSNLRVDIIYGRSGGTLTVRDTIPAPNGMTAALFGVAVAGGDVNGDGYSDVLVGAPKFDDGSALNVNQGAGIIFRGSSTGINTTPTAIYYGAVAGNNAGTSVAVFGDVNGDGFRDFAIGGPGNSTALCTTCGRLMYVNGGVSQTGNATVSQVGASGDKLGSGITSLGDVNGDGFADFAHFLPSTPVSGGVAGEGQVRIVYGSSAAVSLAGATAIAGSGSSANLTAIAGVGDVNGDGFHDLAIGAATAVTLLGQQTGAVWVLSGRAASPKTSAPSSRDGVATGVALGSSVAVVGDTDGDGDAEVVLGVPSMTNGQIGEGSIEIHPGAIGAVAYAASPQTRESNSAGAGFGGSVASAGDVNGDGYGDVIVGAAAFTNGESGEGRFDVFHGTPGATLVGASSAFGAESNVMSASLGASVAAAGDINGDGYGDVIVGAPTYANGQANEGAIYVFYGSNAGLVAAGRTLIESNLANAQFGGAVATAGDVNTDGFDDVIVGSPGYTNGEASEGRVSVYLGGATGLATTTTFNYESNSANALLGTSVAGGFSTNGGPSTTGAAGAPGLTVGANSPGGVLVWITNGGAPLSGSPLVLPGGASGDLFGSAIAAGEFTGDGRADLVVGSPAALFGTNSGAGTVRLYVATPGGSYSTTPDVTWGGSASAAAFGSAVSAGDVDGDGLADLVSGAPDMSSITGRASTFRSNNGDFASGNVRNFYQPQMRLSALGLSVQPRASLFGTGATFRFAASMHVFAGIQGRMELDVQNRGLAFGSNGQQLGTATSQASVSTVSVTGLPAQSTVHARARMRLNPGSAPPFQWTRWIAFGVSGDTAGNHVRTTAAVVDSDADGLNDNVEAAIGTNPNNPDSDADGIRDGEEVGPTPATPRNSDNTGAIDALDTDSDDDGILDSVELTTDPDADGLPSYRDFDSDGDGVLDSIELGVNDTDTDLIPDYLDDDDDDDGIVTKSECTTVVCVNTDGTGLSDYRDTDSDDDGILDAIEGTLDPEADGKGAWVDTDSDGNGILDSVEGTGNVDGDSYLDFVDLDDDGDGVNDASDNCRVDSNPAQANADGDAFGNACDTDDDNDGVLDGADNCPLVSNVMQNDNEPDGIGDACDTDDDNDGVPDAVDNCQFASNATQTNTDMAADGGDACDTDDDNDGVLDATDNCPFDVNTTQANLDLDALGDVCDPDDDDDMVADGSDNCPRIANQSQTDTDMDGLGDACDNCASGDTDADGACNNVDNCPSVANADQSNMDGDSLGDACDACSADAQNDSDGDTVCGNLDNCPTTANTNQSNVDADAQGDVCDACPMDMTNDSDLDTVCGNVDNCPTVSNSNQADGDSDGSGDACDVCPGDGQNDADADSICGNLDNCPSLANTSQIDTDGDSLGDVCDACITDAMNDVDGDGVCGDIDNCPTVANPGQQDSDPTDPRGDACQNCPDEDTDGICTSQSAVIDNCPSTPNTDQANADGDSLGDLCDTCPNDANDDEDADEVCGDVDNCATVANANQADIDGDGTGDACESLPDGGIRVAVDASTDDVPTRIDAGGCACSLAGTDSRGPGALVALGMLGLLLARRTRRLRAALLVVLAALALAMLAGCGKIIGASDYATTELGPCGANYVQAPTGVTCLYDVNALSGLAPSVGTLSPAFAPSVSSYDLHVDVLTRSVRFTPNVLEPTLATIKVNGQVVASGSESQAINLAVGDQVLSVEVESESGKLATYTVRISRGYMDAYVKATNTDAGDYFGIAVAVSGDFVAVGAPREDSNGVSPANSATYQDSGAVYVYRRDTATGQWQSEALIKAEDVRAGDGFGASVAIDGDTLVVGAPLANNGTAVDSGAVYVFTRDGSANWTQQARLRASNYGMNDGFGHAVAIEGDVVVVGAPSEDSSAPGVNAAGADEASVDSGALYVFRRASGVWTQESLIKAHDPGDGDAFGFAVAISGSTVLVGAPNADDSRSGPAAGTPSTDETLLDAGAVYAFEYGVGWTQAAYLKPTGPHAEDQFGSSVDIEGDRALVGAPFEDTAVVGGVIEPQNFSATDSGAAYYFVRTTGTWGSADMVKAATADTGDLFGIAVALESTATDVELVVGAPFEDGSASLLGATGTSNSVSNSGAVYLFRATSSGVIQTAYVKSVLSTTGYAFGGAVALDGSELCVGSVGDASPALGVGGDYAATGAATSGAVFLYR